MVSEVVPGFRQMTLIYRASNFRPIDSHFQRKCNKLKRPSSMIRLLRSTFDARAILIDRIIVKKIYIRKTNK